MKILNLNSSILCIQKCMYDIKNIYLCQEKVLPCCGIVKKKCSHQCSFLRIQFYQNSMVGKNLQFFLQTTGTTVNLLTVSKPTLCWRNQLFYFWILAKLEQLGPADPLFLLCPNYIWFIPGLFIDYIFLFFLNSSSGECHFFIYPSEFMDGTDGTLQYIYSELFQKTRFIRRTERGF